MVGKSGRAYGMNSCHGNKEARYHRDLYGKRMAVYEKSKDQLTQVIKVCWCQIVKTF